MKWSTVGGRLTKNHFNLSRLNITQQVSLHISIWSNCANSGVGKVEGWKRVLRCLQCHSVTLPHNVFQNLASLPFPSCIVLCLLPCLPFPLWMLQHLDISLPPSASALPARYNWSAYWTSAQWAWTVMNRPGSTFSGDASAWIQTRLSGTGLSWHHHVTFSRLKPGLGF
jgi:hypothetical protein